MRTRLIRCCAILVALLFSVLLLSSLPAFASGGHGDTGQLEHVVSLEGKTGLNLMLAELYNEDRLLYALVVTVTMAVLGIVVGQITEMILKLLGIK